MNDLDDEVIITRFQAYLLTEKRVATNTFSAYKHDVDQLISFLHRTGCTLKTAHQQDVKDFFYYLRQTLAIGPRSITRKISTLKVLFAYLEEQFGWVNRANGLTFPKLEKKLPEYLSEKETEKLLQAADRDLTNNGMRNKVMLYLLYVSGMRVTELTGLRLSQFHFDTGFIQVCGKGGKERMVPIPEPVLLLVRTYIETWHRRFFAKRGNIRTADYLFPIIYAGKIKAISRQAFWTILKDLCKKAGISSSISPHKLRHSLATHMLKTGVDLRSLQLLLGHENLSTVQIYTHLENSYLRKVYDKKHPRS